jgi:hypothetical protein
MAHWATVMAMTGRRSRLALTRFAGLSMPRKLLYVEVCIRLVGAWLLVRAVPFRRWKGLLKQKPHVTPLQGIGPEDLRWLEDVQHVFRQIKWATRNRSTCLMMVLVARGMLNRRKIHGTIYLGVRRDATKPGLHAHAWMQSAIGVVGHEDVAEFVVVEQICE